MTSPNAPPSLLTLAVLGVLGAFGLARQDAGEVGPPRPAEHRGLWHGVARQMATSPHGNAAAISSHNCYTTASASPAENLAATVELLHEAMAKGADLLELDIKEESGSIRVDHEDDGGVEGALLGDVLADGELLGADALLFIEIKENAPTRAFARQLLTLIRERGYAVEGRPVALRSFHRIRTNLVLLRELLATPAFADLEPHVLLSELFGRGDVATVGDFEARIAGAADDGFRAVELEYRSANLFGMLACAKSHGLGINVYTIPVSFGEVFVAGLREEVDALTVDYPVDRARAVVEDANALVYLNARDQDPEGRRLVHRRGTSRPYETVLGSANDPTLRVRDGGGPLFGGRLEFVAAEGDHVELYDADNETGEGYFVSAAVQFGRLELEDGETCGIVGKADSAGFALELHNPSGEAPTRLRFGVHVNGAYRYASSPVANLSTERCHFLIGAYDGNGSVRLWVDNRSNGVSTGGSHVGGVKRNDSAVLLGADPQGGGRPRFFFDGAIQTVQVQAWGDH